MTPVVDLGDLCTFCWEPTGRGSGRWVNRIPSVATVDLGGDTIVELTGWLCAECEESTEDD